MKKIYTLILLSVLCFSGNAQYTITSASNPIAGDIEFYKNLNPIGLFHGSAGTGQTWNYSSVSISSVATTPSTYVAMSSVPNSFLFPGATIAADHGSNNYNIYSNNSTKIEMMGIGAASATNCILFSNPIRMYSLPFSYGTSSPDNFAFSMPSFTVTGSLTTTGDGLGTLQLPSGNYANVLKQKYVIYETVTQSSSVSSYTVIESRYFSAVSKFPLLIVDTQTTSTVSGTTTVSYNTSGQINAVVATGITKQNNEFAELSIYPNPSNLGFIHLSFNSLTSGSLELTIVNVVGQNVKTIMLNETSSGITTKRIDVSDLTSGIYFVQLKTGEKSATQKLIIE